MFALTNPRLTGLQSENKHFIDILENKWAL
jgi:hypothetical protein